MAYSLNNLAGLYYSMNEYTNALPLMQRALAIREKALPSNHPLVEQTLENLAVILRAMRRPDEAAPLEQRAQAIRASRGEPGD
jgi:tetratricopeptide (TPR) repeat protein